MWLSHARPHNHTPRLQLAHRLVPRRAWVCSLPSHAGVAKLEEPLLVLHPLKKWQKTLVWYPLGVRYEVIMTKLEKSLH